MKYHKIFSNEFQPGDLKKHSVIGGLTTVITKMILLLAQILSTAILARLLTPQDYGVVAMAMTFTGFAFIFSNLGLSTVTIQSKTIDHEQISLLFWINVSFGVLLMIISSLSAPIISLFYESPHLTNVIIILSVNFFIYGLGVQHKALLERKMRFLTLSILKIVATCFGFVVGIIFATYGFGYWSLVFATMTTSALNVSLYWVCLRWCPGLPKIKPGSISMLKFGSHLTGFSLANYFAGNMDNILIGRLLGAEPLGIYSKAFSLLMLPFRNLSGPIQTIAVPALSRLQDKPRLYRKYCQKVVALLAFISSPIVVIMFICSDSIVNLLLGPQWSASSELFRIFAFAALIQTTSSICGMVMVSMGKGAQLLRWGIGVGGATTLAIIIGLQWGTKGVAVMYAVVTYVLFFPNMIYCFKNSPMRIIDFFQSCYKPILSSLIAGLACYIVYVRIHDFPDIWLIAITGSVHLLLFFLIFAFFKGTDSLKEYFSYIKVALNNNRS